VRCTPTFELGGTDQTFNLLVDAPPARSRQEPPDRRDRPAAGGTRRRAEDVQELWELRRHHERPDDVFGKLNVVSDVMMWRYFELLTRVPEAEFPRSAPGIPWRPRAAGPCDHGAYHADHAAAEAAGTSRACISIARIPRR